MRVEPAALQPADVLLDLYGEDIRARAFVTRDDGAEMMLRPDFTVPIVRLHMDGGAEPARYVYCGPVWRRQEWGSDRPREYLQAGFEIFEAGDPAATDAEVLALIVEALGDAPVDLVTGDLGLVLAAIDALDTSAARKAALRRHVWRPARFRALLDRYGDGHAAATGARAPTLLAAEAEGRTPALVAAAGAPVGLRAPEDVAARVARARRRGRDAAPRRRARSPASRRCSRVAGNAADALAELRGARPRPARRSAPPSTGFAARLDALAARGHRARSAALRGELRPHHARILRRLRLRRAAARPPRPAADRQRRALRRADPGAGAGARHPGGRRHDPARGAAGAAGRRGMREARRPVQGAAAGGDHRLVRAPAASRVARDGAGREYRGTVARRRRRRAGAAVGRRDPARAGGRAAAPRGHRPGPRCARRSRAGPSGSRSWRRWASASPTSWWRCRPSGSTSRDMADLDAAAARVPRPARPPAAGGDQVPPSGPRLLPGARRRRLPAGRQPGRDRGHGEEPDRRGGGRHHHHRLDAARQPPARARRRADPAQPGDARSAPRGAAGTRGRDAPLARSGAPARRRACAPDGGRRSALPA